MIKARKSTQAKASKKDRMLLAYASLCKSLHKYPSRNEFADHTGFTKDMLGHHFGSLVRLKEAARAKYPEYFDGVLNESIFNPKAINKLRSVIKGHKRFVVTTAVAGCSVDKNFLASIKTFCKKRKAELLVLIAADSSRKASCDFVDPVIPTESIVVSDVSLNSNVYLNTIKLNAKQIDPITGVLRIGQRQGGFIYASPKQRLKFNPTSKAKYTHAVMTTGAITLPKYGTDRYMSDRTSQLAENDHIMGAVIVEILDDKKYFFRQVQADSNGCFIDLGIQYGPDGVDTIEPEAIVLGDLHSGETDPTAKACWKELCDLLKPKTLVLHDAFNGRSINHHEENNIVIRAQLALSNQLILRNEIKGLAKDLNELCTWTDQVVIVKSNHDDFLDRYLQAGKYLFDPHNHRYALDLAIALLDSKDPLRTAVEKEGLKKPSQVRWLKRDETFILAGIQLGEHGDQGPNGSRGSVKSMESSYGTCVTGHTHTPEILRNAWVVGTSSYLRLSYTKGASSWMHTSCIVYPNGSRQLINVIDGRWRLED
jgi:hypothetical protein